MPSEPISPCSACWIGLPAERDLEARAGRAASAMSIIRWLSATGMSVGFTTSRRSVRRRAVRPSAEIAAGRGVRVVDAVDVRHRRRAGASRARDLGLRLPRSAAAVGADDDVDGVAGLGRERVLEQLLGGAGVRAGRE